MRTAEIQRATKNQELVQRRSHNNRVVMLSAILIQVKTIPKYRMGSRPDKFDPMPATDHYALAGIFSSS